MITKRYFVDKHGVETGRAQGAPGRGHIEAAKLLMPSLNAETEWYDPLFRAKFMRVAEDPDTRLLHIDAPYARSIDVLPNAQRRWVQAKQADQWKPVLNHQAFVETRDKARQVVGALID